MKRTALLLLTAIYLLSSLGIAANSYYCCGKLQLTTILDGAKQHPDCKMASIMPNCCKTKKQYFKVKDQHIGALAFNLNTKLFPAINIPYLAVPLSLNFQKQELISYYSHAPPDGPATPSYILNCAYRI